MPTPPAGILRPAPFRLARSAPAARQFLAVPWRSRDMQLPADHSISCAQQPRGRRRVRWKAVPSLVPCSRWLLESSKPFATGGWKECADLCLPRLALAADFLPAAAVQLQDWRAMQRSAARYGLALPSVE